jgi:predicted O-linked N-acetylglucosamine transferase (SPINDLY family)
MQNQTPQQALQLWQQGNLRAAEAVCRALHQRSPGDLNIVTLLALIRADSGHPQDAIHLLRRAISLQPQDPRGHYNLGNVLNNTAQYEQAAECYQRALTLDPGMVAARHNLAHSLQHAGRLTEAVAAYVQVLQAQPDDLRTRTNLGCALMQAGDATGAVAQFQLVAARHPQDGQAHFNLGNAYRQAEKLPEAVSAYRRAVELSGDFADAHYNLANALRDSGDLPAAIGSYTHAVELQPGHIAALNNLGAAWRGIGQPQRALQVFERSIQLRGSDHLTHLNMGNCLLDLAKIDGAIRAYRRALEIDPACIEALLQLGTALRRDGQFPDAVACYRRLLQLQDDHVPTWGALLLARMELWDWSGLQVEWDSLRAALKPDSVLPMALFHHLTDDPAIQLRGAAAVALRLEREVTGNLRRSAGSWQANDLRAHRRVRVAYVSPDFNEHPVALSIVDLLARHDRGRFEVIGISLAKPPAASPAARRLIAACDHHEDVSRLSIPDIVARLRALEVDIAVDLAGYTQGSIPGIFAHRVAPIQVSYLGFAGSMGAPWMDYLLADGYAVPPDSAHHYREQIARLPESFFPSDPAEAVDAAATRTAEGLPPGAFVFCCFNSINRITPETADSWSRILAAVPDSVLWLKATNATAEENFRGFMSQRGIEPARVVFAAHVASRAAHLARQQLADLCLDSFPYNCHSTARDALWIGLPVLTRSGVGLASRVAGSLLNTLGLAELICANATAYEARAVELSTDRAQLQAIGHRLRAARASSPLFDMSRLARHVEDAYEQMLAAWQAGASPQPLTVIARADPHARKNIGDP